MMRKVWMGAVVITVCFVALAFVFTRSKDAPAKSIVSLDTIPETQVLDKTKAVLYVSTTADQDIDNKGVSYAVFIQEDQSVQALSMNGLELGSVAIGGSDVLLEDKDNIHIVGDHTKSFKMDTSQYTGERTGYLPGKELFFSIYNSGFVEGGYSSDVRFGDSQGFRADSIPYYIAASGATDDTVTILTQDLEENKFYLKEVLFDKELKVNDITTIQSGTTESMQVLAPVLSDGTYYYLTLSTIHDDTNETVSIHRVNKKTLQQDSFELVDYKNEDLTATIPYNYKNSAALYNKKLYYVNGLGHVYSFDTESTAVSQEFTLKNVDASKIRHNEETYFKEGDLYVLRYSPDKQEHYYLETYSLDNGDLAESFDIKGLDTIIQSTKSKNVYSYDLKVLE